MYSCVCSCKVRGCWNRHVPPRAGAGSRAIALAGFHGFSLANPLGQVHWVCVSIAGFGTGLWVVIVDLGGVPGPLFLGRSNPLALKNGSVGLSTAF